MLHLNWLNWTDWSAICRETNERHSSNGLRQRFNLGKTATLAEFNSDEQVWDTNAQQKSFTYEVATGETLPSGTPFRLGVQLAAAVRSHFDLKREKLGLFFKRVVMEFMIPIFKAQAEKEKILTFQMDEDGMNDMKEAIAEVAAYNAA